MYHIHGDKRVNASVQLITQALLELLEEKPFSRITVADLQRRSTVSRSTFYRCFDRTEDVLAYLCDTGFDKVLEQDLPDAQTLSAQVFRYWMRNTAVLEALVEVRRTDILFASLRRCLSRMDHFPALSDSAAENDYFIAIVTSLYLKKTRSGLNLRAVGENPATADAAGINVTRYKYVSTCVGSMIAGLGGLYYVMDYANGIWSNNAFGDRGWLAIALVIFTVWKPNFAIIGSIIFGGLYIVHNYLNQFFPFIPVDMSTQELIKMAPYVITVLVLIVNSMRRKRESQPPEALGLSYFREDR